MEPTSHEHHIWMLGSFGFAHPASILYCQKKAALYATLSMDERRDDAHRTFCQSYGARFSKQVRIALGIEPFDYP